MKYRPEIDGLRALAVVPVILFHAGFQSMSGGYVGVDVFFVISGFLITSIIYAEIRKGTFSIVRFYERRARRILPALTLVSVSCIPFAWAWMTPDELKDFAQSLVAVSVFSSNILFWIETDYFAAAAELKPLLHTWSLAIEEQFYLFFPLLLLLFKGRRRQVLLAWIMLLSVLSFAAALWMTSVDQAANFYLLPSRAWELGVGAALALTVDSWHGMKRRLAEVLSITGFMLILFAIVKFDQQTIFPGPWTLLPVVGTGLLIMSATPSTSIGKILTLPFVVKVGLISYSAYLWHMPLFAFLRIRLFAGVPEAVYLLASAVSLLLAYLTWRFVENPFRRKGFLDQRRLFALAGVASVAVMSLGSVAILQSGMPERFGDKWEKVADLLDEHDDRNLPACISTRDRPFAADETCLHGAPDSVRIAVWGDSHSHAVALELGNTLATYGQGLRQFSYARCAPAVGYYNVAHPDKCPEFNEEVLDVLLSDASLEYVILIARWAMFFEGVPFDNQEGGIESAGDRYGLPLGVPPKFVRNEERIPLLGSVFRATVERLVESGKRVVVVYPVPEVGWDVPSFLAKAVLYDSKIDSPVSTRYNVFAERARNSYDQLDTIKGGENLVRVYPERFLCNQHLVERCIAQQDDIPLYSDDDHLSELGATILSERIASRMVEAGWLDPRAPTSLTSAFESTVEH